MNQQDKAQQLMVEGFYRDALHQYQLAWQDRETIPDKIQQVWLGLGLAYAALRAERPDLAMESLQQLMTDCADSGCVVGNPFFHLLVAQAYAATDGRQRAVDDNLARALIGAGPALFLGEDPKLLQRALELLQPPEETGTWEDFPGYCRDLLNEATGYPRILLIQKLGGPPPYESAI